MVSRGRLTPVLMNCTAPHAPAGGSMRSIHWGSALLIVLTSMAACEVRSYVTGRPGFICDTDADCDPGLRCPAAAPPTPRRCTEASSGADAGVDGVKAADG